MALKVGSRLGHYDVTALIGEGGMGQVYQATDTKLDRASIFDQERQTKPMRHMALAVTLALLGSASPSAQDSVFLEELTWTEVRDAIQAGTTTVIIPTGGTEQNGPHMVLGKHNVRVRFAAGEIAKRIGSTLVAPVMAYVPEGDIDPPTSHMWAPGTITLPPEHFATVVEYASRSLRAHGFTDIVLIGDSGGNQSSLKLVADMLNEEWTSTPVRVLHLEAYFGGGFDVFLDWLAAQGETTEDIGRHAGIADTSVQLAVDPSGVRPSKFAPGRFGDGTGVDGDPTNSNVTYGEKGLEFQIDAAVEQFRELRTSSRGQ